MSKEQLYLIKISAMCTADGVDVVPSAEFICDADFTSDLPILEALHKLQNKFTVMLLDMPDLSGHPVRPMSRDEVQAWRDDNHEAEESGFEVVEV